MLNSKGKLNAAFNPEKVRGKHAFTLVEILIVMGLIAAMVGFGSFAGLDFYKTYALTSERDTMVNSLIKARNRAMNNYNESQHGLFIDTASYTIFQGSSYASRNQTFDEVLAKNNSIISSGLQEMVFDKLTGNLVTGEGSITLSNGIKSSIISLNNEGRIDW